MSVNSLVTSVKNFLSSHYMFADDEWLSGCVEYITEDSSANYSVNEIQNLAKEQWLLNDLKDICPGCLPANLKSQLKTVLQGKYVLQINAAVDIGTPAYQQYLKLQRVNMENVEATTKFEDKISSHRMIKLYLSDGVQEVTAIEYKPMRNISCDITPGCKAILKGPVECRRGVILLTESSIELLGGEVQEIAISNSLAGLLSSKLGLPITQEPDLNSTLSHPRNTNIPTLHTEMPSAPTVAPTHQPTFVPNNQPTYVPNNQPTYVPNNQPTFVPNNLPTFVPNNQPTFVPNYQQTSDHSSRPIARVTSIQVTNFNDEDIDFDQLAEIEAQFTEQPAKRPKIDTENKNKLEDYPDENDVFEDNEYLKEMEAKFDEKESGNKGPVEISSEPYIYIKQINDMKESDKAGRVFKVKGQIMKLLSKLSVGKDGWSLRCTIVDGTGSIDVDFTSGVLSKLVGYTPQEMNNLKKEMAQKPELKQRAVAALQKAKDTLQVLYCIIELTMLEVPKITCLTPFEESHVNLLKKRLQSSGL